MMNLLDIKILNLINEKLEYANSELVSESCAKEKGDISTRGNPLFNAQSAVYDANSWLNALLENIKPV